MLPSLTNKYDVDLRSNSSNRENNTYIFNKLQLRLMNCPYIYNYIQMLTINV